MFALQILFLVSIFEFYRWTAVASRNRPGTRLAANLVCVVFTLHLISGVYYFARLLSGGSFW
jgi:hypothetical protein